MLCILIFTILYGLVPFLLLLFNNKRIQNKAIMPFTFVVFIASVYEFVGSILCKINVEYWFFIYVLLTFLSIHYFLYYLLGGELKKIFVLVAVFFLIFFVVLLFYTFSWSFLVINSFLNAYQTLIILFFSIIWVKRIFQEFEIDNFLNCSDFYYVSGLLIYYCGTVFLFLSASYIYAEDHSNFQYYWLLNIILNFVLRTLLIVGIWKARRE